MLLTISLSLARVTPTIPYQSPQSIKAETSVDPVSHPISVPPRANYVSFRDSGLNADNTDLFIDSKEEDKSIKKHHPKVAEGMLVMFADIFFI